MPSHTFETKIIKRAQIDETWAWPPLHPDRSCLEWANYNSDECQTQWNNWDSHCYWEMTDQCESVDAVFYSQTLPDGM